MIRALGLVVLFFTVANAAEKPQLSGNAAELFKKAQGSRHFGDYARLKTQVEPTSDGKSYLVVWKSVPQPKQWIVSLHGMTGFATDDLAIWQPHLKGRAVGVVSVQWWLGGTNAKSDYYTPLDVYREVDMLLQKLGVQPGSVMYHGFSRGSANSYPIVAIDQGKGKKYFSLCVASSGGVGLDYPPTKDISAGAFGPRPLEGTRWITCAGGRDQNPERDGIEGMRKASAWLKEQGARVLMSIEDPTTGHGALVLNPKNAKQVLDLFLKSGR